MNDAFCFCAGPETLVRSLNTQGSPPTLPHSTEVTPGTRAMGQDGHSGASAQCGFTALLSWTELNMHTGLFVRLPFPCLAPSLCRPRGSWGPPARF